MSIEEHRTGNCYQTAGDFIIGIHLAGKVPSWMAEGSVRLAHGEVTGQDKLEGVKFGHAWVEFQCKDGHDWALDTELDQTFPLGLYYSLARLPDPPPAGKLHRYNIDAAIEKLREHGHYGPWDLEVAL